MNPDPAIDGSAPAARAPTLYLISAIKLGKGLLLLSFAFGVYSLADHNLPEDFNRLLQWLHLDPERQFFSGVAHTLAGVTASNLAWVAGGTVLYSSFSLVEGIGLIFRLGWAGWLAIAESLFFIPIEVYDLLRRHSFNVSLILVLNILICWYLLRNRQRLFHHHHG